MKRDFFSNIMTIERKKMLVLQAHHAAHQAMSTGAGAHPAGAGMGGIHPAFLHPFYSLHPGLAPLRPMLSAAAARNPAVGAGIALEAERPGSGHGKPSQSFTIDAILGKDGKLPSAGTRLLT